MDTNKQISDKFRKTRLKLGLTQIEFAKKAGLNSNHYAKIERGEEVPNTTTLIKIIKALGIKSSEVLSI